MSLLEKIHPSFRSPGESEPNVAYFIARSSGEAACWAEEYTRPEHVEIMAGANRALQTLRERRIEEGGRELQAVADLFQATENATAQEVHNILGRWYYGVLAYYHYCIEDYRGADEALDRGHEKIRQAIERKRFLLPYAMECYDFWFQRIRIARNQRLWPEVWRRIEITRQIAASERPCCVLSDGTAIHVANVQAFYAGLEDLTEPERKPLRFLDERTIRRRFRSILAEVYTMPGFVIPYTPVYAPG